MLPEEEGLGFDSISPQRSKVIVVATHNQDRNKMFINKI